MLDVGAKLKNEIDTSRIVMEKLKKEIERLSSERDDLKNDVKRKGASKQQKMKEFVRLKLQVIKSYSNFIYTVI